VGFTGPFLLIPFPPTILRRLRRFGKVHFALAATCARTLLAAGVGRELMYTPLAWTLDR
jgi:hypothetical protein